MEVCEELDFHKPIRAENIYSMVEEKQIKVGNRQLFGKNEYGIAYSPFIIFVWSIHIMK